MKNLLRQKKNAIFVAFMLLFFQANLIFAEEAFSESSYAQLPYLYSHFAVRSVSVGSKLQKNSAKKQTKNILINLSYQYFGYDLYPPGISKIDRDNLYRQAENVSSTATKEEQAEILAEVKKTKANKIIIGKIKCDFGYTLPEEAFTAEHWSGSPVVKYEIEKNVIYKGPFPLGDSQVIDVKTFIEIPVKYSYLLRKNARGINQCSFEPSTFRHISLYYCTTGENPYCPWTSVEEEKGTFGRIGRAIDRDVISALTDIALKGLSPDLGIGKTIYYGAGNKLKFSHLERWGGLTNEELKH